MVCLAHPTSVLKPRLNVLFLGRDIFSCLNLKILHKADGKDASRSGRSGAKTFSSDVWDSIHVATTPDRRVGRRGKDVSVSPLKLLAKELNLPVTFVSSEDQESWQIPHSFHRPSPDNALITASFGHAVPVNVLDCFSPCLRLNIHPSLLPKYRGAAPIQRTLADGLHSTGVSILQMEDVALHGFDSGPIWARKAVDIPPNAYYQDLENVLAHAGGHLLVKTLRERRHIQPTTQDHAQATKARLITNRTAQVNWNTMDAPKLHRLHRAISHQRPLHTVIRPTGALVKLLDISLADGDNAASELDTRLVEPGNATYVPHRRTVIVRCSNHTYIQVHRLQLENRRALEAKEWWNGIRFNWLSDDRVLQLG